MYTLLIKHFLRSRTVRLAFGILLLLGVISIGIGKQFLEQKQEIVTKTFDQQEKHIKMHTGFHKDDLGLLMYYLKFSLINPVEPIAGIAIGQRDLNTNIQNVSMLNLEGQKYDTDLVNPMKLQVGNLDLSFVIIFLCPLIIIALTFNLYSEEAEKGTWKMIMIQGKSPFRFLLAKLSVRVVFVYASLIVLFILAKLIMKIPFNAHFLGIILLSFLYITFWFAVCLAVIGLKKNSNTNAIALLTTWLVLVILLPVTISNYVITKYPVGEALSMTIKQRDGYHKKWDTEKKGTMEKFYKHYPQFAKYELKEEGFSWLWYYAMQQMGDDESKEERDAMYAKVNNREKLSKKIATYLPSIQIQLAMNALAKTNLTNHLDFLRATTSFHENIRLSFYPKIFENHLPNTIDWKKYKPEFFKSDTDVNLLDEVLSIGIITFLLIGFGVFKFLK